MTSGTTDIDIFTPTPLVLADEETADLKRKFEFLRKDLQKFMSTSPFKNTDVCALDKRHWCQCWTTLRDALTECSKLAQNKQISLELSDEEQEFDRQATAMHETIKSDIGTIEETVAGAAEVPSHANKHTEHAEKTQGRNQQAEAHEEPEQDSEQPQIEVPQQDTPEDAQEEHSAHKTQVDGQEDDAEQEEEYIAPVITCIQRAKISVPRMSADRRKLNPVQCDRCAKADRACYSNATGMVCTDCKRLKAACSLVCNKVKAKPKLCPVPKPPPAHMATMAGKPITPSRLPPALKGKFKSAVKVSPVINRAYVCITNSRKRKFTEVEEEEEDTESNEKEDSHMAGLLNALPGYISTVETALAALKKQVTEIDACMDRKRRRV
ncbi:hypothetical protein BDR07DRAFT_1492862 [Suillus spraguei]|nr:hypothetical protein BDR07DRAFT_1492862 [Suillus spraguei]